MNENLGKIWWPFRSFLNKNGNPKTSWLVLGWLVNATPPPSEE